jgi:two-component system OmpR family response regulator
MRTVLNMALSPFHVLAIDDDAAIRELIARYLSDNEIRITTGSSGREMADVMAREPVDLLILDLKLRGEDGMQITRDLRLESDVPIIMLTGCIEEADRIMGLEVGADDYLTKPFSPRELLARIRALLRRSHPNETAAGRLKRVRAYRFAGWVLNVGLRRLTAQGKMIVLSNTEFNLLAAFLASPNCVLSREQLLERSRLHSDEVYDRAIDVQVARLRKKIEQGATALIRTHRGAGYVLNASVEAVS